MNCYVKSDLCIRQLVFCFSLIYILAGCTHSVNRNRETETKGTVSIVDFDFLWPTRPAFFVENRMLFIDEKEPCFLHLYDLALKKKLFCGSHIGRGPDEMFEPFSVSIESDTSFWIHDIVRKEIKRFVFLSDSVFPSNKMSYNQYRLLYPNILENNFVIAVNLSSQSDKWINLFDSVGNIIKELVVYPDNDLNIPQLVFMESYQGNLKVKPDRKRFVLACRYTDMLNIYKIDGIIVSSFRTDKPFPQKIKVQSAGNGLIMAQDDETMLSFTDVAASDEYIFGLFSGKSRKEKDPSYCNRIFQFDWDGQFLKQYSFNESLISIAFQMKNNVSICLFWKIT